MKKTTNEQKKKASRSTKEEALTPMQQSAIEVYKKNGKVWQPEDDGKHCRKNGPIYAYIQMERFAVYHKDVQMQQLPSATKFQRYFLPFF